MLPDIEVVSAAVHAAWMDSKRAQGVTTRKAEDGEELMAPYEQLSEKAKQLDRGTVQAVYAAISASASESRAHLKQPSARIVRGLDWIWAHARADFEAGSGEKGTGMFAGTTEAEVDAALDYLRALTVKR